MINRQIEKELAILQHEFPIIAILGPPAIRKNDSFSKNVPGL